MRKTTSLKPSRARPHRCRPSHFEALESRILCSANLPAKLPVNPPHRQGHHQARPHVHQAMPLADAPPPNTTPLAGASPAVVGRYTYYGATPKYGDTWATNKLALLPTQTATFANVTNYVSGINEVVLDVANAATSYDAGSFVFRVGQSGDPYSWSLAPAPSAITVARGAGSGGSTRIFVSWASGSIVNEWLQTTFTPANDTFYFGNLVGDTGDLQVNESDEAAARANPTWLMAPATLTNPYDFNRDGKVDATDQLIARAAGGNALTALIAPMPPPPPVSYDWHTQTINGALNIWAPNPGDYGSTFTVTDPTALFGPDGVPQIEGVHQGPTADCYFLGASGSIAYSNPGRIQSLVANDSGGSGWAVTFQYFNSLTGNYMPVVIHTSNQLSSSLQTVSNNEVWPLVLEKTYAAFRTWNGVSSQNTMASLNWGFAGTVLLALNDNYQNISITGKTDQWVYSTLQSALTAHQPIDFHTSATATTMVASHVYVITGVSTDTSGVRWVTTYNPWGFYETRTESDLLLSSTGSVVIGTY